MERQTNIRGRALQTFLSDNLKLNVVGYVRHP